MGKDTRERFWSHVCIAGPDDCWIWAAARDGKGYPKFKLTKWVQVGAHRFAAGAPRGLHVHHTCGVRDCCNPAHLQLVTEAEHLAITAAELGWRPSMVGESGHHA